MGFLLICCGYKGWDYYHGVYHGIDQNPNDKRRFKAVAGGMELSSVEDPNITVFQKYDEFRKHTRIEQSLKKEHIQFDLILKKHFADNHEQLKNYKIIILGHLMNFNKKGIEVLTQLTKDGVNIIATNEALMDTPGALKELFGAEVKEPPIDAFKYYLQLKNQDLIKRQVKLHQCFLKCNFTKCKFSPESELYLPLLDKGREGPPEMIGGHVPTGWYGLSIYQKNKSKMVYIPCEIGRMYHTYGFFAHKDILLDVIDYFNPEIMQNFKTDAPPKVEITCNKFRYNSNTTDSYNKYIINLINLSGFNGHSYFEPLEIDNIHVEFKVDNKPEKVYTLKSGQPIKFEGDTIITFTLDKLEDFEAIIIE